MASTHIDTTLSATIRRTAILNVVRQLKPQSPIWEWGGTKHQSIAFLGSSPRRHWRRVLPAASVVSLPLCSWDTTTMIDDSCCCKGRFVSGICLQQMLCLYPTTATSEFNFFGQRPHFFGFHWTVEDDRCLLRTSVVSEQLGGWIGNCD